MYNPVSTYRIQFHKGFNFKDLEQIIPYVEKLGVKTIYASPIFKATPGSMHGYDITDPQSINPEIGTIEQLITISKQLHKKKIGWIQDIVPNHMAFTSENLWLMDLLEKGELSAYKTFFDQSTSDGFFKGPIMVPFLGSSIEEAIEDKQIEIAWHTDSFVFKYADQIWPLNIASYPVILRADKSNPSKHLKALLQQVNDLSLLIETDKFVTGFRSLKFALKSLFDKKDGRIYISQCLQAINADKQLLLSLAHSQHYRLCSYAETDQKINYRRFFTVNGLICINIDREEVFTAYHRLIKQLVQDNVFQGLRVDHVDGLFDPGKYLDDLRQMAGNDTYIVAEKILEEGERLIKKWPIQGTTGYDFLSFVNNLLTNESSERQFTEFYQRLTNSKDDVHKLISEKKSYILTQQMGGELANLTDLFIGSKLVGQKKLLKTGKCELKEAIAAFIVHMPVYRYYGNTFPLSKREYSDLRKVFEIIKKEYKEIAAEIEILQKAIFKERSPDKNHKIRLQNFYQRCMQFTGPVMAKGVEDTLMYSYNSFVDHNEVGDSPETFSIKNDDYHAEMVDRQKNWPLALNGTSTHDTKRGEDVRARLNALTDLPGEWFGKVDEWIAINKDLKEDNIPDANDEYLIYQTLIGAYPMPGNAEDDFEERLLAYLEKALREAKVHSNWVNQDDRYEAGTLAFAKSLLNKNTAFWKSFEPFHKRVSELGVCNSLAQVLMKFTSPGIPDVYQGCEAWDLSLVDPDNRRPIDYTKRENWLYDINKNDDEQIPRLWQDPFSAHIKLWLLNKLLVLRKADPLAFKEGDYIPLKTEGRYKAYILSFARKYQDTWYITIVPLNIGVLCIEQQNELPNVDWSDTRIILPKEAPNTFESLLSKIKGKANGSIPVASLFAHIPVALLRLQQPTTKRGAGVLAHITSLPSPFGIGDLGAGAVLFIDKLHKSRQKYWQLLPLSPVEKANQYSPYSSWSAMGGNTMLISPGLLVTDGLLAQQEIDRYHEPITAFADFTTASWIKKILFEVAWTNFKNGGHDLMRTQFADFVDHEADWLDDFALYEVLKSKFNGNAWYEWDQPFRTRQKTALNNFTKENKDEIQRSKWLQFIFQRQWQQLKDYANDLRVNIIGDLPFYISYDSADVWANPAIFKLNESGNPAFVAGVPPDYFNADGQLWGMPVFNWDALKETNYSWWIKRIRKNIQLFDIIRLDHFRAFSSYWSVPANENTAINGKWEPGPGSCIFDAFKKEFGTLPFIAEDLGDIDEEVYSLRDEFDLPGMKVIQFAFGGDVSKSPHIPHNYSQNEIAYTGTHDNNTTRGWYVNDIDDDGRKQVNEYAGSKVKESNVNKRMIDLVMASAAKIVIVPIQDLLGLDETARMNVPAATEKNWIWRLTEHDWKNIPVKHMKRWSKVYNRS